jgi:hypothetical protein
MEATGQGLPDLPELRPPSHVRTLGIKEVGQQAGGDFGGK